MPSLKIITLGCSKNTVDTEHLLAVLEPAYTIVEEGDAAARTDFLLLNTCGFIGDAKEESIAAILEAVQMKKEGNVGKVVVFGCLSQRYERDLREGIPEVDAWFGARDFNPLLRYLGVEVSFAPFASDAPRHLTTPRHYAFLKISEGCDRRCSYCAIPLIRGRHVSVPLERLVAEAKSLAAAGVKELIVVAQDTGRYGLDLYGRRALATLLEALSGVDGIEWIRMHYCYPDGFPDDVLALMASNPKICPYLDIPLQHASDRVLSQMHRHTTGVEVRAQIEKFRHAVPGIVLRTTLMVGHPGEGEKEFAELMDFVRDTRFDRMGAFKYSEEEGTYGAGHYRDEVPAEVKQERLDALMTLQAEISLANNRRRIGTVERVIVDSVPGDTLVCRSRFESPDVDGEILVKPGPDDFPGQSADALVGQFMDVEITDAEEYDLLARPKNLL
ncbi:MAG: 30S ribosomal protein S12 methylthiotransferase RimO [Bacteroidales bacterium]|nr:30S ribosomal protein S12 methylthiotransferase RimO [Bacteroidales bacterium]